MNGSVACKQDPRESGMEKGTQDSCVWRFFVLARQALRNFYARSRLQTVSARCPGLGLRGSRRPNAGICRLSHWDTKESFPGCSKRFDAEKASASRQLGDLVTDRYWRNGVLASQRKVQVKLKSLGIECCDPRGLSVCPS